MGNDVKGGHEVRAQEDPQPDPTSEVRAQEDPQPDPTSEVRFKDRYTLKGVVSRNIPELSSLMQIVVLN